MVRAGKNLYEFELVQYKLEGVSVPFQIQIFPSPPDGIWA
jgi:hypothetical protein